MKFFLEDFDLEDFEVDAQALSPEVMPPGQKTKITIRRILKNLATVLFLFAFEYGFIALFGNANSMIGVALAAAVLRYLKVDMGLRPLHGALLIFYLFLHAGCFAFISSLNPYVGIVVNLATIYFLLTLSGQQVLAKSYFPFLLCYIFCIGSPVQGTAFGYRMLGLAVGGAIVATVYFICHHKEPRTTTVVDIVREIHLASTRHQFIVRMTVGLTIAMFIGTIFGMLRPTWISMTVQSLTVPFVMETRKRVIQRMAGTILGGFVFLILFEYLIPESLHGWCLLANIFISLFITDYMCHVLLVTLNILKGGLAFYSAPVSMGMRIAWVLVGTAIVVAVALVGHLRPLSRLETLLRKIHKERLVHKLFKQNKKPTYKS